MPQYGREYGRWGGYGQNDPERGFMGGNPGGYDAGYHRFMQGGQGSYGMMGSSRYDGYGGGYGAAYGGMNDSDREMPFADSRFDTDQGVGGMGRGAGMGEWGEGRRGGRQQSGVRAAEIMTENPEAVTPDTTLADVARRMRELDVGIIPVVDDMSNRRLRGVITDRDIAVRAVADGKGGDTAVSECMTDDIETVNKNDSVHRVMQLMQREQVRRVPVTDREGRLVGIIAQADLTLEYTDDRAARERMVEDTIERISEPGGWRGSRMR